VNLFLVLFAAVSGLLVGSFLNVCIHRIPRGRSIVFPGSRCPACGAAIRARDNVPVFSWLLLAGKCRDCRAPIAFRYPAIELANAILWTFAAIRAVSGADFAASAVFFSSCLVLIFIDLDFQILPDVITLPLAAAGIAFSFFSGRVPWRSAVLGLAAGAGILWAVAIAYEKLTRREGMGMGDVKMLGAIGAFTGPRGVLFTILFGSLAGSLAGIAMLARGGDWKTRLPFGVFLGLAGIAAYFWAAPLWEWYRGLLV
jgi:leader peptidase (prepilin peptidase)/N-methyltransferase